MISLRLSREDDTMMHDASVSCQSISCEERKVLEDDDSGDNMENDAAPAVGASSSFSSWPCKGMLLS